MPIIAPTSRPALLALSNGAVFRGQAIGASGLTTGELAFHTSITGYQEVMTTPASFGQLLVMTYPMIGNVGVNDNDNESDHIWAAGLIIRQLPTKPSNWRMRQSLTAWLEKAGVVGIAGVDTRGLTNLIRDEGMLGACIVAAETADDDIDEIDAIARAKAFAGFSGQDLTLKTSTKTPYPWTEGGWTLTGFTTPETPKGRLCVIDCGVRRALLRAFVDRGYKITVLPASSDIQAVDAVNPNGVIFSDGAGDASACGNAIALAKTLMDRRMPLLGVGLGHQILAVAAGAAVTPLKSGHHGVNHPVRFAEGFATVSQQNQRYVVDGNRLPDAVTVDQVSLFDQSIQGLLWKEAPIITTQGYPDPLSAPKGATHLFDRYLAMVQ